MAARAYRRDQLCELFWDVADDPRAELRWSLSKLRGVLDDEVARIEAGREEVAFRAHGASIDVLDVRHALAGRALSAITTDELEGLARRFRGDLLEGLDLPDFDVFQAWSVAQREEARLMRGRVLVELVQRLRGEPARALDHARTRVSIDPHDEAARAVLVELLAALGRRDEAQTHYESGRRLAGGTGASSVLEHVWRQLTHGAPNAAVSQATRASGPTTTEPVPLIGRDGELAVLDDALAGVVATQHFASTAITGIIGSGKSRLLAGWRERAGTQHRVVCTNAFEADAGRPYGPWLDALARLPEADARPRPELAQLSRTTASNVSSVLDREQLYEGVSAAIADVAMAGTLVLAIDDAHWLDAGSAALLVHVARRCERLPVLIVLFARPGELEDNAELARGLRGLRQLGAFTEHELPPLDAAATALLVRAVRPAADVAAVFARSGGNPLFALELARALDAGDGAAPSSVATAIRDRLETLPDDAALVLRWGAVLRRDFMASDLDPVTGLAPEAIVDALDLLCARALLVRTADARHAFAHELVRQVVHDAMSEARRRLMHRRVAEALAARVERGDERADIADVAHHAAAAHEASLAVRTCLTAARRSLRVFASADAVSLAHRGLRHVESMPEPDRTRHALELIEVAIAARSPSDGEPIAQRIEVLAERALDLGAFEHARLGYHMLAYLRWERGAWSDAQRHMRHAQMISRRAPEAEQIVGMAEAARCLVLLEKDLPEAQALALEAAARGRLAGVEPPATFAALGMLHVHQGRLAEARAELERALSIARARRDRHDEYQALEQLAMLELEREDGVAARTRATELATLGARFEEGSEGPFARGLVSLARIACEEDGARELDVALAELAVVDAKQRLAYLASRAAWYACEREAYARASALARQALTAALPLERTTDAALARAVLARSGDAEAIAHLDGIVARWGDIAAHVRDRLRPFVADRLPIAATRDEDPS